MTDTKHTIRLTDDNWADYFSDDYPASLVKGLSYPDCLYAKASRKPPTKRNRKGKPLTDDDTCRGFRPTHKPPLKRDSQLTANGANIGGQPRTVALAKP
jgi:hypothetical protein